MSYRIRLASFLLSTSLAACAPTFPGGLDAREAGPSDVSTADVSTADVSTADVSTADVSTADASTADASTADASTADASTADAGPFPGIGPACFPEVFDADNPRPAYDPFEPILGSHCQGTNHQDITGVERVVFLGDSITVGTPPTASADFYRSRLADALASRFGLATPEPAWRQVDPFAGAAALQRSGGFASCARWGARTNDLLGGDRQLAECFPEEERQARTLVVLTAGGNDIASIAQNGATGPYEEALLATQAFVDEMRDAVLWLKEPGRFPSGVFVVFAGLYEYTDGTGDLLSCPGASAAGLDASWTDPEALADLLHWANEQYLQIAVETGTDMGFLFEPFCGRGFRNDDVEGRCYRGPDAERWFDATCIHPTPGGHEALADLFLAVVSE